jgi:hypothetical protein
MRLLHLAIFNVDRHSYQRVDRNVVHAPLQMQFQVFSLITEELALFDNDSDLFRQPPWRRPQHPVIVTGDGGVEHKDGRNIVDGFPSRNGLVSLTPAAPSL